MTSMLSAQAWVRAAGTGLGCFAAAMLCMWLMQATDSVAHFQPADPLLIGVVLRLPRSERPLALVVGACAIAVANLAHADSAVGAALLTLVSMTGVLGALMVLGHSAEPWGPILTIRQLGTLWLAGVMAAAVAAWIAAVLFSGQAAMVGAELWLHWWAAGSLSMLLLLPLVVTLAPRTVLGGRPAWWIRGSRRRLVELTLAFLSIGLLAALLPESGFASSPVLFSPILLWLALRFGLAPTAIGAVAVIVIVLVGKARGIWLIPAASGGDLTSQLLGLKLLSAFTALPPLVVAAMVAQMRRTRAALAAAEQRYVLALEGAQGATWDWDVPSGELYLSPRWRAMLGLDEAPPKLSDWTEMIHPDDRQHVRRARAEHLAGRAPALDYEYRARRGDGRWIWLHGVGRVVDRDSYGRPLRVTGIIIDITMRKTLEQQVVAARARLEQALEVSDDAFALYDPGERLVACNAAYQATFAVIADLIRPGVQIETLIRAMAERGGYGALDGTAIERFVADRLAVFRTGGAIVEVHFADQRSVELKMRRTASGDTIVIGRDVTERKRLEQELERMALQDPLTGLPNRTMFKDELKRARARAERDGDRLAVMLVDLDRFKEVNDSYGHAAGDAALVEAARRLQATVRAGDLVARLGGDEFAILASAAAAESSFAGLAQRVVDCLAEPLRLDGIEPALGGSVGLTVYPDDPAGPEQLLVNADRALYAAKAAGRGTWAAFREGLPELVDKDTSLGAELARAAERDELRLAYQPILAIDTLEVLGAEALVRWDHPERGWLMPDAFIAALERGPAIQLLTRWVLERGLVQQQAWRQAGLGNLRLWVNLAPSCLAWDGLEDAVTTALAASGAGADRLGLEVTEGAIVASAAAKARLAALRRLGVTIAIDDFGTGHSSLARLKALPLDMIKIDRAFTADLAVDRHDQAIVRTIAELGQELRLGTTAEGIETREQLAMARRLGCKLAQGYLFARPMPGEALRDWFATWLERRRLEPGADLLRREEA